MDWIDTFEGLSRLPAELRDELVAGSSIVSFDEGAEIFGPGHSSDRLLLLLEGTVKVQQRSETGREVFLYRVHAGDSCVLTTACMLSEEAYNAEGVAETEVVAVTLPKSSFDRLAAEEDSFRRFVFSAYSRRLIDLLRVVDDVAFGVDRFRWIANHRLGAPL